MPEEKQQQRWESWFVLCDVAQLRLWRERFCFPVGSLTQNTCHPARRRGPLLARRLLPAPEWSAAGQQGGGGGGADWTSQTPHPAHCFFSVMHTRAHTLNVNTLGLWQRCVCFSLCIWIPCSCMYDCMNALANEAHDDACHQFRWEWEGIFSSGQQVGTGLAEFVGEEVRSRGGRGKSKEGGVEPQTCHKQMWKQMNPGISVRKTLALLTFEPQNPAWDPTPQSLHPPTLTLPQADCPPRGRWRQTERRRVPPFGQTVV